MVAVGWNPCILSKNIGFIEVLYYLQEEINVNRNAVADLLTQEQFCFAEAP